MVRSVWMAALFSALVQCAGAAVVGDVVGVPVEDSYAIEGGKVVLNGAGLRKRAFFKTDVTAIYLRERHNTAESIENAPGPKRLQLILQRDLPGPLISRYFISDFKAVASDAEFKQLINEISDIGAVYAKVRQVSKGDVVNIDWTPGKGIHSTLNGKPLTIEGRPNYINNELMYRVMLRMYIAGSGSDELRENLLGRSRSMLNSTAAKAAEQ